MNYVPQKLYFPAIIFIITLSKLKSCSLQFNYLTYTYNTHNPLIYARENRANGNFAWLYRQIRKFLSASMLQKSAILIGVFIVVYVYLQCIMCIAHTYIYRCMLNWSHLILLYAYFRNIQLFMYTVNITWIVALRDIFACKAKLPDLLYNQTDACRT